MLFIAWSSYLNLSFLSHQYCFGRWVRIQHLHPEFKWEGTDRWSPSASNECGTPAEYHFTGRYWCCICEKRRYPFKYEIYFSIKGLQNRLNWKNRSLASVITEKRALAQNWKKQPRKLIFQMIFLLNLTCLCLCGISYLLCFNLSLIGYFLKHFYHLQKNQFGLFKQNIIKCFVR